MSRSLDYNGGLTREQFLFYEIRVVAKMVIEGIDRAEIRRRIVDENLFQFPTEREFDSMVRVCLKRIDALDSINMVDVLANGPADVAKQINLYAMMRYNLLVWDFMVTVVGEKFRTQDFELTTGDVTMFLVRLQEQNDTAASWSDSTIAKLRQVLRKCLIECGFIDNARSTQLNPVYPYDELIEGIKQNNDFDALSAFNYFG